ncbi:phage tail protein [Sphingomonas nostoxanthinifaciens]|uniref:hypothetical protein n=1 Tax=Sphingomonas nostoxanthinifaciens TaxID=2872652 RepID=UPI001CC1E284|nr:hypothetical protein [Sphingomonas nostoxanthinifaciens]UAK23679.1 hypothetical protein K8P63_15005 [Sphingomonas nostoxanthinifaciens]
MARRSFRFVEVSHVLRTAALVVGAVALVATGVGAIAGAAGAAAAGTLGEVAVASVASQVASIAAIGAIGLEVGATLTAKKPTATSTGTPDQFTADPAGFLPYGIGRHGTAGNIVFRKAWDTSDAGTNDRQSFVVVLSAGGPSFAFESFNADTTTVNFANDGPAQGSPFDGFMWQTRQLGAIPTPTAMGFGTGAGTPPGWGADRRLHGMTAATWTLRFDTKGDHYQSGVPKPIWVMLGHLCYDPRKDSTYPGGSGSHRWADPKNTAAFDAAMDTWEYSDDPYLHGLRWALGTWERDRQVTSSTYVQTFGMGAPIEAVDVAAFVEGANVARTNGWKAGGVVYSGDGRWDTMKKILQAGMGEPIQLGAKVSCYVNAPKVVLDTVNPSDLMGDAVVPATQSRLQRINRVVPRYYQEANQWQLLPGTPIVVADYFPIDGGQRTKQIDYPLINVDAQIAVAARYDIENSREFGAISLPLKLRWIGYKPGDCIAVNLPEGGLVNQPVLLLNRSFDPASLTPIFTARSETVAKHPFALGQTTVAPPTPGVSGPTLVPTPGANAWAITGTSIVQGANTLPALVIAGAVDRPTAEAIVFEYRVFISGQGADAAWIAAATLPPSTTGTKITAVIPGQQYEVAVSYLRRSAQGARQIIGPVTVSQLAYDFANVSGDGLDALVNEAAKAASDAGTALSQLGVIASDRILSRGEKPAVIADWNAITAEIDPLVAQASALGVASQLLIAARDALATYLTSIGPYAGAWADVTVDSPVNPVNFRAAFTSYYTAKINLIASMTQSATNAGAAPNELPLSDFSQGLRGFLPSAPIGGGAIQSQPTYSGAPQVSHTFDVATNLAGWFGVRNSAWAHIFGLINNYEYFDVFSTYGPWTPLNAARPSVAASAPYMLKVKNSDRVYARCSLANHRCDVNMFGLIFDKDGNLIGAPSWAGARGGGGQNGDPATMNVIGAVFNVADVIDTSKTAAYMMLMWRMYGRYGNPTVSQADASDGYMFMTEPAMGHMTSGQTALPPYTDGPGDPMGDVTGQNVALDTTNLAGRSAAQIAADVDTANSTAATAKSTADAVQAFTDDVADNNHASPDEKKRYRGFVNDVDAQVSSERIKGEGLGCAAQADAMQNAWNVLKDFLINTVQINDVGHQTYFDRGYFHTLSNAFASAETVLAQALQDRAKIIAQDTGANVFLDPLFRSPSDSTCWAGFDGRAIPQDSGDGRRLVFPPDQGSDVNVTTERFVIGPYDYIDIEFEYYVQGSTVPANGEGGYLGIWTSFLDGNGSYCDQHPAVAIKTDNCVKDLWTKFVGRITVQGISGNINWQNFAACQLYIQAQPITGGYGFIRNPKGYRVANSAKNLGADGRQASAQLTTAFAISASVQAAGFFVSGVQGGIQFGDWQVDFGDGFTYMPGGTFTGFGDNQQLYLYLIAPNMSAAGASYSVTPAFQGNTDKQRILMGAFYTNRADGSPGGSSGGGSGGGACVAVDAWLMDDLQAGAAAPGAPIDLLRHDWSSAERASVDSVEISPQPCVRLRTARGAELVCSIHTPIELPDGTVLMAPAALDAQVASLIDGTFHADDRIVEVQEWGVRPVAHIHVGGRVYAAGTEARARVLTHNPIKP